MKQLLVLLFLSFGTSLYCQLIKEYNECAVEALDNGRLGEAIDYFTRVITINPLDSFAYFDRGLAYESSGKYCDAIADFTRAIKIDPGNVDNYFLRAIAYDKIGNYDLAVADYNKTIEIENDNSDAHYYKARIHIKQGNYPAGIEELNLAISYSKDNAKAYGSRGWARALSGDYKNAVSDLELSIAIDSAYLEAYYYRAWVMADRLLFDKALADYRKILRLNSGNDYFEPGTMDHTNKAYATELKKYYNSKPNLLNKDTFYDAGLLKVYLQDYEAAIVELSNAIVEQPFNSVLYYFKGYACHKTSDWLGAETCYTKAIELDPAKPSYYYTRGRLLYDTGEKERAFSDFLKCTELGSIYGTARKIHCD